MPRSLVWTLYAVNVLIWSSHLGAIKIGLEDVPPLLSAGVRFALAGAGLLVLARVLGVRCGPTPARDAARRCCRSPPRTG